jgi:hypothetical protein
MKGKLLLLGSGEPFVFPLSSSKKSLDEDFFVTPDLTSALIFSNLVRQGDFQSAHCSSTPSSSPDQSKTSCDLSRWVKKES